MNEKLVSKFTEYRNLEIRNTELKKWIKQSNLWCWVYSIMRIEGIQVSRAAVADMLEGNIREDVPLSCYGFMQNYKAVQSDMISELNMKSCPDKKLVMRWADMLDLGPFRRNNPVVFDFGLIPYHFNEIEEGLEEAAKRFASSESDPVYAAAKLFMDIMKVYPYGEGSLTIAFTVLHYCLEALAFPLPELYISSEEFAKLISKYMDKGDLAPFVFLIEDALLKRLEAVISVAQKAEENDNKA